MIHRRFSADPDDLTSSLLRCHPPSNARPAEAAGLDCLSDYQASQDLLSSHLAAAAADRSDLDLSLIHI